MPMPNRLPANKVIHVNKNPVLLDRRTVFMKYKNRFYFNKKNRFE